MPSIRTSSILEPVAYLIFPEKKGSDETSEPAKGAVIILKFQCFGQMWRRRLNLLKIKKVVSERIG